MSSNGDMLYLSSNDDIMILRRDIFQALADPTRRSIIILVASQAMTAGAIAANFDSARSTVSKHLQILTESGLLDATVDGREILYQLRIDKVKEVDQWLHQLRQGWEEQIDSLDSYLAGLQTSRNETIVNAGQHNNALPSELFVIDYTFQADVELLFDMWVNTKHLASWLGPDGAKMWFLRSDATEGGQSQWGMTTPDGVTKYGKLNYKIINPRHLLVYVQHFCNHDGTFAKAPFSDTYPNILLTTVSFREEAGATKITVRWEIFGEATDKERSTFASMKPAMATGWTQSFVKLASLVSKTGKPARQPRTN